MLLQEIVTTSLKARVTTGKGLILDPAYNLFLLTKGKSAWTAQMEPLCLSGESGKIQRMLAYLLVSCLLRR